MIEMAFRLLGGIGLFLIGMSLLTDGLKAFAGRGLQDRLSRLTGTPARAFLSGALVTLLVQSSSATTVALIGFVSAGLVAFPQAVGIVMGASLGTTGTGWLVAVLGLKVSLGVYALPLVGVGAVLHLLARGRWRSLGLALAGFGTIFIGIDALQAGMTVVAAHLDLARVAGGGAAGTIIAVAFGLAMTVVMQSSSAAVATTLTALHVSAISFEQAAAVAIGASIGTTATGVIAAVGGTVPAKRTALVHVMFNLATGMVGLALLPLLLWGIAAVQRHGLLDPGAVSLAAFHTAFIAIGVAAFLPAAGRVAQTVERLLPDRGLSLTRYLDDSLLAVPQLATGAVRRTLVAIALQVLDIVDVHLGRTPARRDVADQRQEVAGALERTQAFLSRIPAPPDGHALIDGRLELMHATDHLNRLLGRLGADTPAPEVVAAPARRAIMAQLALVLDVGRQGLTGADPAALASDIDRLAEFQDRERLDILRQTIAGGRRPGDAMAELDAVRWLARVGGHVGRIVHYLSDPQAADRAGSASEGAGTGDRTAPEAAADAAEPAGREPAGPAPRPTPPLAAD